MGIQFPCTENSIQRRRKMQKRITFCNGYRLKLVFQELLHFVMTVWLFQPIRCHSRDLCCMATSDFRLFSKGQIILKGLLVSSNSPKKRTNKLIFTTTTNLFFGRILGYQKVFLKSSDLYKNTM